MRSLSFRWRRPLRTSPVIPRLHQRVQTDGTKSPFISDSNLKTHQVVFELDAIYPLDQLQWTRYDGAQALPIDSVSIDLSLNGQKYSRVLTDVSVSEAISHLSLGTAPPSSFESSFPRRRIKIWTSRHSVPVGSRIHCPGSDEWSDAFLRYDDWTGADGIFSFNLNGDDSIGAPDPTSAFIFSDTFVGSVNPFNKLRLSNVMINNSVGYFDGGTDLAAGLSFAYDQSPEPRKARFS